MIINDVNIFDSQTAFRYKSDKELKRAYYVFGILQYQGLSKLLIGAANLILKFKLPFKFIIRHTVYHVFCSGEKVQNAIHTIQKLSNYQVKSVLDYVAEDDNSEVAFNNNTETIVQNIKLIGRHAAENYISVKLSGIEDKKFLNEISSYQNYLNEKQAQRLDLLRERMNRICYHAQMNKVIVFFDAEENSMQDIFDRMVEEMMEKYNKNSALVYNTLQMYLKDRLQYLQLLLNKAKEKDYKPGIKLVRGAYVNQEKERAKLLDIESPVFETKEETDYAFNKAVEICLSEHENVFTCIATHNEESVLWALQCLEKYNLFMLNQRVKFSQLYGMSDHLTFNLAAKGMDVSKYLPYGEIEKAIPYLIRRAEENTFIKGQMLRELRMIKQEIKRRKING